MLKNSIVNAISASAYITFVAIIMNLVSQSHQNKPDTFFAPVAFLSLFTFSAAVMAYLFFYQPLQLLITGKKKEALDLFFQTVVVFGTITIVFWILLFSGII